MVESVEIEGLRGIKQGKVEGLTPLTVLVGPNGCGKSTVLDVLLIGSSNDRFDVIGRTISEQMNVHRAARWLFWKVGKQASLRVNYDDADFREVVFDQAAGQGMTASEHMIVVSTRGKWKALEYHRDGEQVTFSEENYYGGGYSPLPHDSGPPVRLLEPARPNQPTALHDLFSEAEIQGQGDLALDMLRSVVPGLRSLRILTEAGRPSLYFGFDRGSVPVALAGDGVHNLARLCFELATLIGGVVLIEEPEVHQHPRAIAQTARAIWAAVRRGVQVVLSTHSLELIDALLAETQSDEEVEQYSVQRLSLADGLLSAYRVAGRDLAEMRVTIEEDLR